MQWLLLLWIPLATAVEKFSGDREVGGGTQQRGGKKENQVGKKREKCEKEF